MTFKDIRDRLELLMTLIEDQDAEIERLEARIEQLLTLIETS